MLEFRRATAPLAEMLDRLATEARSATADRLRRRFREERAHLLQLSEGSDGLGDLLSNLLQANLTEVSVRQKRRHAPDLGLGRDLGRTDPPARHLRHEFPAHAGAPLALQLSGGPSGDGPICVGLYRGFGRGGWL